MWEKIGNSRFVNGKIAAEFFQFLVENNTFRKGDSEEIEMVDFEEAIKPLQENLPLVLSALVDRNLYEHLIHGSL